LSAPRFTPDWLELRRNADDAARAADLLDPLRAHLASAQRLVIRDLGCGTGSQGRWLTGRLPGPQHWILHDRDPALLARARANLIGSGTVETREGDVAALRAEDLAGTSLVTASALLDLLTFDELDGLVAACAGAGCPALLTLSVAGEVELTPADPLDVEFGAAFNAHQRRDGLLGPDAIAAATDAFRRRGAVVWSRPSPWRLGADQTALAHEWLRGWVAAACEQRPDLLPQANGYLHRRLNAIAPRVVVQHVDLLAICAPS
jgi:SAM-dependent methyltransferase